MRNKTGGLIAFLFRMTALDDWLIYCARRSFETRYIFEETTEDYYSDCEEWDPIPGADWPFPDDGVEYEPAYYYYPYIR